MEEKKRRNEMKNLVKRGKQGEKWNVRRHLECARGEFQNEGTNENDISL